jgi:hypothetical protein
MGYFGPLYAPPLPSGPGTPLFDYNPEVSYTANQGSAVLTPTTNGSPTTTTEAPVNSPAPNVALAKRALIRLSGASYSYGTTMATPANWTLFLVANSNATNDYCCGATNAGGANQNSWGGVHRVNTSNKLRIQCGDGIDAIMSDTDTFTWTNGQTYAISGRYTSGDNFVEVRVDGADEAATTTGTATTCAGGPWTWSVGRFGAYTGNTWNGDIYRVVVYNSALSDGDRASIETQMMGYYL